MIERPEYQRRLQTKPCWWWSGVETLNFSEQTSLRPLMAMLPAKQSSDDQILALLVDLRARYAACVASFWIFSIFIAANTVHSASFSMKILLRSGPAR